MISLLRDLAPIITGVLMLAGVIYTATLGGRNATKEATKAPYEAMRERLEALESRDEDRYKQITELRDEVDTLRSERHEDRTLIRQLFDWLDANVYGEHHFTRPGWLVNEQAKRPADGD